MYSTITQYTYDVQDRLTRGDDDLSALGLAPRRDHQQQPRHGWRQGGGHDRVRGPRDGGVLRSPGRGARRRPGPDHRQQRRRAQLLAAPDPAWTFHRLAAGGPAAGELYVHSDARLRGRKWQKDYCVRDAAGNALALVTAAKPAITPVGPGWYKLGSLTLPASAVTVSYHGSSGAAAAGVLLLEKVARVQAEPENKLRPQENGSHKNGRKRGTDRKM